MLKTKKQINKDATLESQRISQEFLEDYKELVKKYHRDFDAVLDFTNKGINARLIVIEFTPPSGIIVPGQEIIKPR